MSAASKPKHHDLGSLRDTIESIWVAIVLAFVLRAFMIEAFSSPTGSMAERLMGDHEEDNRPLVDAFFERYRRSVLAVEGPGDFNPLETYLPAHTLDDLAFVQSRQAFFLRQTCAVINEYLDGLFPAPNGKKHAFPAGEQEKAWAWFWDKVIAK